ncbi:hypothetical protein TcasGA2_TC031790 [Tribolium castaneum]|uniref:Uncharacterized protein n=1 Tax=Tribolium castaneum TaxID=7070 RepID=A0A139WAC7_TRICA|nr:hypothetical protein TcasGA2_TC031790 [Tribolium castaneum]
MIVLDNLTSQVVLFLFWKCQKLTKADVKKNKNIASLRVQLKELSVG